MTKPSNDNRLHLRLKHVMDTFQKNRNFMGTVLVAKDGNVLLEESYGMADVEWSVPNSIDSKFRLASITKQFTATAILQLAKQHKLSLDDTACKYFSLCPKAWKRITIRQLLSHTSGIPSYTDDKNFLQPSSIRIPKTPAQILLLTKNKPLEFKSGTQFKYDNSGYIFLGVIIEKVSGEKYADYIRKHIFEPLGMSNSGYDDASTVIYHRASGYQICGNLICNSDYFDMSIPFAAGALYSTVGDLYKWDRALYSDKILSKSSRELMFTAVMNNYGYGWDLAPMFNHQQVGHGGGIVGFSTYIARFPKDDAVVIVLSNVGGADTKAITADLAGTLFGERIYLPDEMKRISIDNKFLNNYGGNYQIDDQDLRHILINVTNENGHLMLTFKGHPKFEVIPFSPTQFFIEHLHQQPDLIFTFIPGKDGKAKEIKLDGGGTVSLAKRIE